jgi:hypothetical protein
MNAYESQKRHDSLFRRMAIALRMAYLHLHALDPDVGRMDVDALLHDVLVAVMGETAFQAWLAEALHQAYARREES